MIYRIRETAASCLAHLIFLILLILSTIWHLPCPDDNFMSAARNDWRAESV
jgi:hypothetical protein